MVLSVLQAVTTVCHIQYLICACCQFPNKKPWIVDESWTIKKAEHQRTDAFKLCWRRVLRVPWTSRRSNQSILKEINFDFQCSLEGLMMKLQYFGHMMRRADYLEKIGGNKRKGQQRMRWLYGITNSMDMNLSKL